MGGRGASSKLGSSSSKDFYNGDKFNEFVAGDAEIYLGYGNGGDTDKWLGMVSDSEAANITLYTGDYYMNINEAMRNNDTKSNYFEVGQSVKSALDKSVLTKGIVVHRGDNGAVFGAKGLTGDDFFKVIKEREGTEFSPNNFVSTSPTRPWGNSVHYHITVPKGKGYGAYVKRLSAHASENEFLINSNVKFKVTKVEKSQNFNPTGSRVEVYMSIIK